MDDKDRFKDIDALLGGLFPSPTLEEIFDRKLEELRMSRTASQEALGITYRQLKGVLSGQKKMIDFTLFFRLAAFLQMEKDQVIKLYMESLERNIGIPTIPSQKITFIKKNFDLAALKKAGFIRSVSDFLTIEKRIVSRLGLRSIFEYKKPSIDVAFSAGFYKPENDLSRAFWIQAAIASLERIDNQNDYSRDGLVKFFPRIRWYSINEEHGLVEVIKQLYKIGVTVIFQPPLANLQLRGATFVLNNKPCIVLTNYKGFYPTLWFALIHELYHVLFDIDEIRESRYHLTDDSNSQLAVIEREDMANEFAREYLCPKEKMEYLRPHFNDSDYVHNFALSNHVHPSIVYALKAHDTPKLDKKKAYQRLRNHYTEANLKALLDAIGIDWRDDRSEDVIFKEKLSAIYNH